MSNNTKEILEKYNIRLDKNKSQNYLIDDNKINFILNSSNISSDETILEIGAGIGTLTIPMAHRAKNVIAIEKDPIIADVLNQRIIQDKIDNVEVINADALKIDYPSFDKIISNLPYQISSPVTFKLLEYPFKLGILMYQLEFARRMQAKPDTQEYSRLSVSLHFRAECEIIDTLNPNAFIPQPKVKSAIIKLIPKRNIELNNYFNSVNRALFQHRNKKARKALVKSAHEIGSNKKELKPILDGINNNILDEKVFKLTPEEIRQISLIVEEIL
ncbi:MAG: 16S ribosomal RNA methyltransferase A [Methanosphaera sp.]|nr:16S ribosomal RNA methyltransferase A [Methanosphaera sp.]